MHHGKRVSGILSQRLPLPFDKGLEPPDTGSGSLIIGSDGPLDESDLPEPVRYVAEYRPAADRLTQAGRVHGPEITGTGWRVVVVALARNRVQSMARIGRALKALAPGGVLIVDGQKTDGVDALLRQLGKVLPLQDRIAKAHGKIAWVLRPETLPDDVDAWIEAAEGREVSGYWTAPGMFSADGVDPGTAFLASHLSDRLKGRAADLGAGWGALSDALLKAAPGIVSLDLVEADYASLEAARRNVTDPRAAFRWADATKWEGGPYDLVVMNPPFHTARAADPDLGRAFLATAAKVLTPKGRVFLVANRQLPYERTLGGLFRKVEEVAANTHYKIIEASQPMAGKARR